MRSTDLPVAMLFDRNKVLPRYDSDMCAGHSMYAGCSDQT